MILSRRTNQEQSERAGASNARLRRIIAGSEVILTTESIEDLQEPGSLANSLPFPLPYHSRRSPTRRDLQVSLGAPFLQAGPAQPISQVEKSLGELSPFGGFDPFSIFPLVEGGPIPKKTLMCYCKHFLNLETLYLLIVCSSPTPGAMAE
jgi:hypothetical protein